MKTIAILLFVFSTLGMAQGQPVDSVTKIGSNVLGAVLIGDINVFYEKQIAKRFSLVSTAHYIPSGVFQKRDSNARLSLGVRTYTLGDIFNFGFKKIDSDRQGDQSLLNNFVELKTGLMVLDGQVENTFEVGGGCSQMLNEHVYYEWKLGLARVLKEENTVLPLVSGGIGFIF